MESVTTFAGVGSQPRGLAFDRNGNLFVANGGSLSISRITPGGLVNNSYITGLSPHFIAFDRNDNIFVSASNMTIRKYDPSGVLINATFGGTLGFIPTGIHFDAFGTLFVQDYTNGAIRTISANGAVNPIPFLTGLHKNFTSSFAFDSNGYLYVANHTDKTVLKVDTGGKSVIIATGFSSTRSIVVDCVGIVYISNWNGNSTSKVTPQGIVSTLVSGLSNPFGLALDSSGNLYVGSWATGNVTKIEIHPSNNHYDITMTISHELLGIAHGPNIGDFGCSSIATTSTATTLTSSTMTNSLISTTTLTLTSTTSSKTATPLSSSSPSSTPSATISSSSSSISSENTTVMNDVVPSTNPLDIDVILGIVGGVLFIVGIIVFVLCWIKRSKKNYEQTSNFLFWLYS